ncbi:MAG: hypothetical protein HY670_02565 [Chloroflexi bacterium]|nr:hypothetical protein [Chloroflexota bacterium]
MIVAKWRNVSGDLPVYRLNDGGFSQVYLNLRQYANFFQPTMKLVSKTRCGAKVRKVYDTAKTPYQRLLDSGVLTPEKKAQLAATYAGLNPVRLLSYLNGNLEKLWKLVDRATPNSRTKGSTNSVTGIYEATTAVR